MVDPNVKKEQFLRWIDEVMRANGLLPSQLAKAANIPPSTLLRLIENSDQMPSPSVIKRLASVFGDEAEAMKAFYVGKWVAHSIDPESYAQFVQACADELKRRKLPPYKFAKKLGINDVTVYRFLRNLPGETTRGSTIRKIAEGLDIPVPPGIAEHD